MTVRCDLHGIEINIPSCAFSNAQVTNPTFIGTGTNCSSHNNGTNFVMNIPASSECGTTVTRNASYIFYSNAIIGTSGAQTGPVIRTREVRLDFTCAFESDTIVSSENAIRPMLDNIEIQLEEYEKIHVSMGVYTDDTFADIVDDDFTLLVPEYMNVAVSLQDDDLGLVLSVRKCWATPSADSDDTNQYVFIDNYCNIEHNFLNIVKNGVDQSAQFSLQSFQFSADVNAEIYLHCRVRHNTFNTV